ncbi:nucleoside deaminase [Mycolicibacillus trivialis]|uniref:Cytidine deaminase n=1 Tax=Mycolicibacillus trivialis TaxID=1798 RepID=A0A1X2EFR3_9MYCO|nr:nucleoside deaminase [Mycolicibacillus trivialis]ORX00564.1 cytidine deaminase [Mycolicibacillus trivialis]
MALSEADLQRLGRCVELAGQALAEGDEPFGSLLVDGDGNIRAEDRNRTGGGDPTAHPEFALARWAAEHLAPVQRVRATVYTSGEHCPMCAAAHGWVGLGRIVYATSATQLSGWLQEWGVPAAPVATLPIATVVPRAVVDGPAAEFEAEMKALYAARYRRST